MSCLEVAYLPVLYTGLKSITQGRKGIRTELYFPGMNVFLFGFINTGVRYCQSSIGAGMGYRADALKNLGKAIISYTTLYSDR